MRMRPWPAAPGPLSYEWFIDGDTVDIYEKYADSEATITPVSGFIEKWAGRFMHCVDVTRFVVYGEPNSAVREILDGCGAVYLGPWGGSSR